MSWCGSWKIITEYTNFWKYLLSLQPAEAEVLKRKRAEILSCPGSKKNFLRVSKIQGYLTVIPIGGSNAEFKFYHLVTPKHSIKYSLT